ncbi:hypothetical protein AN640_05780 [Candidatus Epulonipiscium fishelsonii]|uniref:Uncharacterized protein n=1 Tax=Candidatus Epulonipiscium fishelsonii TaxID=77094 RepID=A0ACC8XHR2_9FIRM|nr:hypothetical protein AN640_05780 [Epulopiscium sp. SCG-D08WGA-EpuloA1]OON97343.1 MAG: hypothetical protein ATN32_05630 [Epulopiscium sp. AS2M-Bin002]
MDEVGQVQIADDVIAVIAEIAALEVDGLVTVGSPKQDIMHTITGKKITKGIKVDIGEEEVFISVSAVVEYGVKVLSLCQEVQQKVKSAIETMTGLLVRTVDVYIIGVQLEKTN